MAFISVATNKGFTIDNFRAVSAKHAPPQDIDGLLAWAAGSDEDNLYVVSMWESRAHMERYQAEQLFPAFQASGMPGDVPPGTEFTEYEAGELYIR